MTATCFKRVLQMSVIAAAQRPLHIRTPLLRSLASYSAFGKPLLFKMEALQPSGSFKMRGIGRLSQQAVKHGASALYCASGGNAGIAVAFSGKALGVPVTIVVPETTAADVRERIAATGARVNVHGSAFDEADAYARQAAEREGAVYIHPFDHPLLWEGHASLIDEVVEDGTPFDCVIASVGGGGLMAGLIEGLHRNGLSHVPLIAVETEGADSLAKSIEAGERITLPAITSIATSLGARTVAARAFDLAQTHPVISLTVTDADALAALVKFADAHRVLVEPACGAALAVADGHAERLSRFENPLVVVCGGIGVSLEKLDQWRSRIA